MPKSFAIIRTEHFLGKKLRFGEPAGNTFVRISNDPRAKWERPVHEIWCVHGEIETLKEPLIHESGRSITQFVHKINFYAHYNAQFLFKKDDKAYWYSIIIYPLSKFVYNYIVKQGFRDGTHGFLHALFMSFHSFITRAELYLLQQNTSRIKT